MTNDNIIGTEYKNMIDSNVIETALNQLDEDCIAECVINPATSFGATKKQYSEFLITKDKELKDIDSLEYGSKIIEEGKIKVSDYEGYYKEQNMKYQYFRVLLRVLESV